jgi:RNA polymerase sigma factor (sigma-70 family)
VDDTANDFAQIMQRLRNGEEAAFTVLYARYGDAVRHVVRQKLNDRLRSQFDSLDFVQDVWASFVALPAASLTFTSPEILGRFLTQIARHKVIEIFRRRFQTQAHDIDREQAPPPTAPEVRVPALQPSASQLAIAQERWDDMLDTLPEGHRVILERLREGYTHEEIAAKLGVSARTVERVVRRLKDLCGM